MLYIKLLPHLWKETEHNLYGAMSSTISSCDLQLTGEITDEPHTFISSLGM